MFTVIVQEDYLHQNATALLSQQNAVQNVFRYEVVVNGNVEGYDVLQVTPFGQRPYLVGLNMSNQVKQAIEEYSNLKFKE